MNKFPQMAKKILIIYSILYFQLFCVIEIGFTEFKNSAAFLFGCHFVSTSWQKLRIIHN